MSDETGKPKSASDRRATTIDLDKTAVRDITDATDVQAGATPKAAAGTDSAAKQSEKTEAEPSVAAPEPTPAKAARAPMQQDARPAAPDPQPATTPPPSPVPKRGSSAGGIAGGAVAGAIFGLVGAYGLQTMQKPPVVDPRLGQFEANIAALEKRVTDASQVEQRLKAEIARAEARANAAEGKAAAAEQKATIAESKAGAFDGRATAVEQRAEAANQKSAAVEQMAAGLEQKAGLLLAPLEDRLKSAEARLADARDQSIALGKRVDLLAQIEPPKVDLRPLVTKIDELERNLASTAARITLSSDAALAVDGRMKGVEGTVKGVEAGLKTVETGLKSLETVTKDLTTQTADLSAQSKVLTTQARDVAAQTKGLETAVADLKARKAADVGATLSVINLARRALDDGQPLGPFVTALNTAGVPEAATAPLAPFMQNGAPRAAALADLYAGLAARLPAAKPAAPKPDESLVGKVTSGLWSQVEVKSVGAPDATGIGNTIRQRLASGDLAGALDLLKPLTAEQQAILKPFSDAVAARIGAAQALRTIETDALASLARKG